MEDYERPDDIEGMGCIAWTMASIALGLALIMFTCAGCEDDGDTTVYEAPTYNASSNGQVIVVTDNSGPVNVNQATGGNRGPNIYAQRNTGSVNVVVGPPAPATEEESEP